MSQYQLNLTENQIEIVSLALNILARLEGGQLEWIFSIIPWKREENLENITPLLKELQYSLTGMTQGNLGIRNLSEQAKIAYDIHQVISYQLAIDRPVPDDLFSQPSKAFQCGAESLATIEKK